MILSAIAVAIFIICELVAGGLYVCGFPVSKRMEGDDQDYDDNNRPGDYFQYLYVMGLLIVLFDIIALIITVVPNSWVYKTGAFLVIMLGHIQLFIMVQVQSLSGPNATTYPRCNRSNVPDEDECSGDKINFVATVLFMFLVSSEIGYAVLRAATAQKDD